MRTHRVEHEAGKAAMVRGQVVQELENMAENELVGTELERAS